MKLLFGVVIVFVVLYMLFLPIGYMVYARGVDAEFSALLLSKATDYAGEAAMAACMEVTDVETEYADENHMVLSPDKAADTFAAVLCLSYNLPTTAWNIDSVKQTIPVMVLATNDGYYVAERQQSGNGESALMWNLKRPYAIDGGDVVYGVRLGMDAWYAVDKQTLALSSGTDYTLLSVGRETMLQHINLAVNRDVNAVLNRYVIEHGGSDAQGFHLPLSANTVGVRRIERPSLIIVMRDVDLDGMRPTNLSVVSGMAAAQRRTVLAWTDGTGGKYYCYDGYADAAAQHWITQNGVTFDTVEQAAMAGYAPYPTP